MMVSGGLARQLWRRGDTKVTIRLPNPTVEEDCPRLCRATQ